MYRTAQGACRSPATANFGKAARRNARSPRGTEAVMPAKLMLGPKVRRLRRESGLSQAQMAEQLAISPSYLNLIEHNQRPVTVALLLKLAQNFGIDLQRFAEDDEARLLGGLREVLTDALFRESDLGRQDLRELAAATPGMAEAMIQLYGAYRQARLELEALAD